MVQCRLAAWWTAPFVLFVVGSLPAAEPLANTQPETVPRMSADDAAAATKLPPGFRTTVFAAEPDVQQPIAATFDSRGRMWVAENYTYAESAVNYDLQQYDKIVILADTNGDGQADKRTVFWDKAQRLTSVEVGFGGVWAMCPPQLLFIPDKNGDDVPDSEPVVMLDGWDIASARHNFANGLKWGPDGWLYGRNGILANSKVGTPETPLDQRTPMNVGMWRFHPQTKNFEVVCVGTTNPWGHDWDENGQLYFINTVIGHFWHVVPGAHYRRMFGEDLNPFAYKLIEQTADHVHWDSSAEEWTAQRKGVTEGTSKAGGGHAHSGMMIYQGDNWPKEYRGGMFTVNLHGLRLNHDAIERSGATYVGKHRPDFMQAKDPWFRAVDLMSGPDGGVYVLDWSDIGECHENDGVHRTSGRIYKIDFGTPAKLPADFDLSKKTTAELIELQSHANEWYGRTARRLLQERFVAGEDFSAVHQQLWAELVKPTNPKLQLRRLWVLDVTNGLKLDPLLSLIHDRDEHVRATAVQLLANHFSTDERTGKALLNLTSGEQSGLVLTTIASAMQRLPSERHGNDVSFRIRIGQSLATKAEFAEDRVLPLMVWYGLEAAVMVDPEGALSILPVSRMPIVTECLARRLASELERRPHVGESLVHAIRINRVDGGEREALTGMSLAVRGWQKVATPKGWTELAAKLDKNGTDPQVRGLVQELSIVFGDGRAIAEVLKLVGDGNQSTDSRRQAIQSLSAAKTEELAPILRNLITHRDLADAAVKGLAAIDLTTFAPVFVENYNRMPPPGRDAAATALASRADAARLLLNAVADKKIPAADVSPFLLRQMQVIENGALNERILALWPDQRLIAADRVELIAKYRDQLDESTRSTAELPNGRMLFEKNCAKCHKLFGQGGAIGPELTGAQRTNLHYLLENIVDPSATLATNFRMSIILQNDGRVVSGVIGEQTDRTITVQTPTEKVTINRADIDEIQPSKLSLMPDGLFNALKPNEVRDLIGYLMSPQQVPLSTPAGGQ